MEKCAGIVTKFKILSEYILLCLGKDLWVSFLKFQFLSYQ